MAKHKVLKSRVAGIEDFAGAVARYAEEMSAWHAHMQKVFIDPVTMTPKGEHAPYPAPQAHPQIVSSVSQVRGEDGAESFVPDFEIVDDSPPAEMVLRQKKNALLMRITELELAASHAATPPGKRRLFSIRESDIHKAEGHVARKLSDANHVRRAEAMNSFVAKQNALLVSANEETNEKKRASIVLKLKDLIDRHADEVEPPLTVEEINKSVAQQRSQDDAAFLEEQKKRHDRSDAIARHAAQLQHDVEDLTAADVDSWVLTPFPEG